MSFYVEDNGGNFERCPPGNHLARCYRIIDLGTQKSEYQGQVKYLHKISVFWEVHGMDDEGKPVLMNDGRPYGIFKNYTLSWSDKANLRLDLQSWRGKPFTQEELRRFDLKNILNQWCMLNIIEKPGNKDNRIFSNIAGISPVPGVVKQAGLPAPVNKSEVFKIDEADMEMFNGFSENLKAKISSSPEWQKLHGKAQMPVRQAQPAAAPLEDDDIPF